MAPWTDSYVVLSGVVIGFGACFINKLDALPHKVAEELEKRRTRQTQIKKDIKSHDEIKKDIMSHNEELKKDLKCILAALSIALLSRL